MSRSQSSDVEECSWCGERRLPGSLQEPEFHNQFQVLLNLLGLSPSIFPTEEQEINLCSECNDLVHAGVDYRKRLEEVKATLKQRPWLTISKTGNGSRIGERISKCFLNCTVLIEPIESIDFSNVLEQTSGTCGQRSGIGTGSEPTGSHPTQEPSEVLQANHSATSNSVTFRNPDTGDPDGSSVVSMDASANQSPEPSAELLPAQLIIVENEFTEVKPDQDCKVELDESESSVVVIRKPSIAVEEEEIKPSDAQIEDVNEASITRSCEADLNERDQHFTRLEAPALASLLTTNSETVHVPDIEVVKEMVITIEKQEISAGEANDDTCADDPSNQELDNNSNFNGDPAEGNVEDTEESESDFTIQELSSSGESSDDDPTFDPDEPPRLIRRQTRACLKAAGKPIQAHPVELPPETSFPASKKRRRISPKIVTPTNQLQRLPSHQQQQPSPLSNSMSPSSVLQTIHSSTPLLTKTTVTRIQCIFCTDSVPETSDHLLGVHNLVRQFGNYYSCHSCLQAYLPSDPTTRTGLLTTKELDHFKDFVKQHENCPFQLEETIEPQLCRICKKEFRSGPDCINHEYKSHAEKPKVSEVAFCTLCPDQKDLLSKLESHMKRCHGKETIDSGRLYGCCGCSAAFQTRQAFFLHNLHHAFSNVSATEECVLCESHSDSVVNLYGHYYSKHGLNFLNFSHFACIKCNQAFQSTSEPRLPSGRVPAENHLELEAFLRNHLTCSAAKFNSIQQQCRYCPFKTLKSEILIQHEKSEHFDQMSPEFQKYCSVCALPCDDLQLVEHLFRHIPADVNLFKPSITVGDPEPETIGNQEPKILFNCSCSAGFASRDAYIAHCNVHVMDEALQDTHRLQLPRLPENECCLCTNSKKIHGPFKSHYEDRHNLVRFYLDLNPYFTCKTCSTPFKPSRPDQPLGQLTPEDVEAFKAYAAEHSSCTKQPMTEYECRNCEFSHEVYSNLKDLATHHFQSHQIPLKCQYCSVASDCHKSLKHHMELNHSQKLLVEIKCHRCWKKLDSFEKLQKHLTGSGVTEVQSLLASAGFTCLSCNVFFDSTALLALHIQEYHDRLPELSFNCLRCSQLLKSNDFKQSDTYVLELEGIARTFKTFTALCTQHHQNCLTQNSAQPCTEVLDSDLRCYACNDTSSATLQDFAVHLNSHVGFETAFKCPVCTHITSSEKTQKDHLAKEHNMKSPITNFYHCSTCLEPWKSATADDCGQGELRHEDVPQFLHFTEYHTKCKKKRLEKFKCKFCVYEAISPMGLFGHEIDKHTRNYPIFCDQCGQGFVSEVALDSHLRLRGTHSKQEEEKGPGKRSDHSLKIRSHSCPQCSKSFTELRYLKIHEKGHQRNVSTNKKRMDGEFLPFVCPECGKDFATLHSLKLHQRIHAVPYGDEWSICEICGKTMSKKYLKGGGHNCAAPISPKKRKRPEEATPLAGTSEVGAETPSMPKGRRNKKKGGPFLCSECGKVLPSAIFLKYHMHQHTGERPYKCTHCGRAFMTPMTLKRHKTVHQEKREKNIPCPLCDKMFFRKSNVDQHVRVFHNKLPWPSKIKSYTKWIPKNPEALAAAGIEYKGKSETESESDTDTGESD